MSKQKRNSLYLPDKNGNGSPAPVKGDKGGRGRDGVDGKKGLPGQRGQDGLPGHSTKIVGSFGTNTPDNLPRTGAFPAGWDDGVNPPVMFYVNEGETIIDRTTGYLWTLTPAATTTNWSQLGQIQPVKGEMGLTGGIGDKGERGETGYNGTDGNNGSTSLTFLTCATL